uniref:Gag-pol polyprotein n=1 Tax=Solanum tuberosum TaxID=4113 RepID=M1A890_SOLTU
MVLGIYKSKKTCEMEREAEEGEILESVMVGRSKMHVAMVTRTYPEMNTQRDNVGRMEGDNVNEEAPPQANQATINASAMSDMEVRLRNFARINPLEFLGSKVGEDPQEYMEEIYKILYVIGVTLVEKEELAA